MREIVVPTFVSMPQPISRTLEQLADIGVRLVELHGDAPEEHVDLTDAATIEAISDVVRGLPLKVHSVHCAFSRPSEAAWDISQPEECERASAIRNRASVIRATAQLGARHVIFHPGVRSCGEERMAQSRASLARLAEIAADAGTRIAIENLPPNHLGGSLHEMELLLEDLDPAVVGFCLDTGHAMLGENPTCDYVRALGRRIFAIHWHGNDCVEDSHHFPQVAEGEWDGFLAALDEVGCHVPVTLEAAPPAMTSLQDALAPVRAVLQAGARPDQCELLPSGPSHLSGPPRKARR